MQLAWCKTKHMTENNCKRLEAAIEAYAKMTAEERGAFINTEDLGGEWNPDRSGDFAAFREEKLSMTIILYCLAGVVLHAEFFEELSKYLTKEDMAEVWRKSNGACKRSHQKSDDSGYSVWKIVNPFYRAGNMRIERLRLQREAEDADRQMQPMEQGLEAKNE
jgi:hypothetical protein